MQPRHGVPPTSSLEPPPRKLRVAIAEDDETQLELLQEALEAEGFQVVAFQDGLELVDYFLLAGSKIPWPDVIVTDVGMPGRSGLDAVEMVRAGGRQTPVLIITGSQDPEVRARAARVSNALLFFKPIVIERLAAAITHIAQLGAATP